MTKRLSDILIEADSGFANVVKSCHLISLWEKVVDERVRKNTEAVKVRNRVLYVSALTPTWAQELTFLKKEIIRKFNEKAGEEVICDIRFKSLGGS